MEPACCIQALRTESSKQIYHSAVQNKITCECRNDELVKLLPTTIQVRLIRELRHGTNAV